MRQVMKAQNTLLFIAIIPVAEAATAKHLPRFVCGNDKKCRAARSRNTNAWTALLGLVALAGFFNDARASQPWRTIEQPTLKASLEQATHLQTESLGAPALGVNTREHWLVPNHDGKSWDVLQVYFKQYAGPTWLHAVDLGTKQVTKQRLPDNYSFYLSGRVLGFDGKYYIATPSGYYGGSDKLGMYLFVYDPDTNTIEPRGLIVPGLVGENRPIALGPDGRIYGTGSRGKRVGLYIYDPKLARVVKDFGPVGPSHPNGVWARDIGVDDTHAYIISGMIPAYYLVAVNLKTGEDRVLLESPTEREMHIAERFPGASAILPQGRRTPAKEYWLYHGRAMSKTGDTPPWPAQTSPWDKATPRPEVYFDQLDPDVDGNATLWYRSAKNGRSRQPSTKLESPEWNSIRLEGVETYPHRINTLSVLPDGRLYGTGTGYVGSFLFDPKTERTTYLGPRVGLSIYTTIVAGGKLYFSGYSGGPLLVYDPRQPWTMGKGGPPGQPAPRLGDAASNPRRIGAFRSARVAIMHDSALGADGKVYFGGSGERSYTGGGFGWYDPTTATLGGFWKPLSGYAVYYLAPAESGRLIVISTVTAADELNNHRVPEEAKLFVYDVKAGRIVREIVPVPKARTTGLIAEVAPGRLLGLTIDPQRPTGGVLYGVDAATGETTFRKTLPWLPGTDPHWPHWTSACDQYQSLLPGPDGFLWAYLKDVLVRIDPNDARVYVVGKIDVPGVPTFVGRDLYFAGSEQLRRIREIAPVK